MLPWKAIETSLLSHKKNTTKKFGSDMSLGVKILKLSLGICVEIIRVLIEAYGMMQQT
jgi:hypothetical protein